MQKINDKTIDYVSILAQLDLSEAEKSQAGEDMTRMLDYIDMLNEVNTEDVEPMTHLFPITNIFREDREDDEDNDDDSIAPSVNNRTGILKNAPLSRDHMFQVPKTVE